MMESSIVAVRLTRSRQQAIIQGLALLLLLLLALWCYWPGLSGPLLLDDYGNLSPLGAGGGVNSIENLLAFVFGNTSGPTGRPISMLSFVIDAQDWPPVVASFKYTNVMIHLLCGVSIFWFSILLFRQLAPTRENSAWLALAVCALWLLHPFNLTTTLYVVQRMTQLMTLFALASLICYLSARSMIIDKPRQGLALLALSLFPFGVLAVLSKENGVLLLLLIVIMESTLFATEPRAKWLNIWYRLGVLFPLTIVLVYLLYSFPDALAGFETHAFSMGERLLTEFRLISLYIIEMIFPNNTGASLFHDDIQLSTSLFRPLSTLAAVLFIGALLVTALVFRHRQPVLSFGILWFLALHLLESTYLPLELYFEHRNYFAMIGPAIALVWYANSYIVRSQNLKLERLASGLFLLLLAVMAWLTWQLALLWGNSTSLMAYWASEQPRSLRAQVMWAGQLVQRGAPQDALESLLQVSNYYPNEASLLLYTWNLSCENELQQPYSLQQIASTENLENYRGIVTFELKTVLKNLSMSTCEDPPIADVLALFDKIGELPLSAVRRADFHLLYAEYHVSLGQLDPALIHLTRSFQSYPSPEVIMRQALLSASAGNYADALVFLERARESEKDRRVFQPSYLPDIERLQAEYTNLLQAQ